MLAHKRETSGRQRKLYSLTDAGRSALEAWLRTPPNDVYEMQDMAVLQLFFSEYMSTSDLVALAKDQIRQYEERLKIYGDIVQSHANTTGRERRMAPLYLGVRLAKACIEC